MVSGSAKTGVARTFREKKSAVKTAPKERMSFLIFSDTLIDDRYLFNYSTHKRKCQGLIRDFEV